MLGRGSRRKKKACTVEVSCLQVREGKETTVGRRKILMTEDNKTSQGELVGKPPKLAAVHL